MIKPKVSLLRHVYTDMVLRSNLLNKPLPIDSFETLMLLKIDHGFFGVNGIKQQILQTRMEAERIANEIKHHRLLVEAARFNVFRLHLTTLETLEEVTELSLGQTEESFNPEDFERNRERFKQFSEETKSQSENAVQEIERSEAIIAKLEAEQVVYDKEYLDQLYEHQYKSYFHRVIRAFAGSIGLYFRLAKA